MPPKRKASSKTREGGGVALSSDLCGTIHYSGVEAKAR